ncbi:MAG: hypothetical protein AAGA75_07580 [Cyanobacteria bacterium P01_E01_bin.6]
MDLIDPFMTFSEVHPDFDDNDSLRSSRELLERQDAIDRWLRGETSEEEVLDTLSSQGLNPDTYVDNVVNEVQYIIDNGIVYASNDSGLLLPSSHS